MSLKQVKTLQVRVPEVYLDYESFNVGDDYIEGVDKLFEKYSELNNEGNLFFNIEVKTGLVTNWPKGVTGDFHTFKIVDTGIYTLLNNRGKVLAEYEGYVPECIGPDGYGDYFEFEINEKGYIVDWAFGEDEYDEFMSNVDDEEDE